MVADKRLFRLGDLIPMVCSLVLAGVLFAAQLTSGTGEHVLVQTPSGEQMLALSENTEQVLVGHEGLTVTITVQDGEVWVTQADCPDQVCVHTGRIGESGRSIACLPAGIVLTVVSDNDDVPDAVAR